MSEEIDMYAVELSKWNRLKEIEKEEAGLILQQTNIIDRLNVLHKERNVIFGAYIGIMSPNNNRQQQSNSSNATAEDPERLKQKEKKRESKAEREKKRVEEEEEKKRVFEQQTKAKYEEELKAHRESHNAAQEVLKKQKAEKKAKKSADKQVKKEQKAKLVEEKAQAKLQKKNSKSSSSQIKDNIIHNNNVSSKDIPANDHAVAPNPKPTPAPTTSTTTSSTPATSNQDHNSRSIKARSMIFSGPLHLTDAKEEAPKRSSIIASAEPATGSESTCPQCQRPVLRTQANVSALGQRYHRACFKCCTPNCQKFISTITAVEVEGKPYCKEHAEELRKNAAGTKPLELPTKESTTTNTATTSAGVQGSAAGSGSEQVHHHHHDSESADSPEPEIHMIAVKPTISLDHASNTESESKTATATTPAAATTEVEDNRPSSMVRRLFNKRREAAAASAAAGGSAVTATHSSPDENQKSSAFVSGIEPGVNRTKSVIVRGTSAAAARFGSSQEKCDVCGKTVYVVDKIAADGKVFHKPCLRCQQCDKVLKLGNYASLEGKFYCKPHFKQLFMEKGNYSEGFGGKKLTQEWADNHGKEVTPVII